MPTRFAHPQQWRQRRQAIEKKGFVEAELLMESELIMPSKSAIPAPASPMSIASVFDLEIKPIVLPGAWTVVGKGGKPIKPENKMYDPPKSAKKKKARTRSRKVAFDEEERLEALASASTSCARKLQEYCSHDEKAMRGRDVKQWKRYREAKKLRVLDLEMLIDDLAADDEVSEPRDDVAAAQLLKKHSCKADRKAAKTRRQARLAARDARCYSLEAEEEYVHVPATQSSAQRATRPLGAKAAIKTDNKRKGDAGATASRPNHLDKQPRKATGKATGDATGKKCSIM